MKLELKSIINDFDPLGELIFVEQRIVSIKSMN
jgi:hypothetical protein